MSDLDFLDDLDDAGGYIANETIQFHRLRPPTPIIASSLSDAERRAQYRPPRPPAEPRDESWRPRAACAGLPSDWWVPFHETTGRGQKPSPAAVATCAACPVREECLAYAVKWREHRPRAAGSRPGGGTRSAASTPTRGRNGSARRVPSATTASPPASTSPTATGAAPHNANASGSADCGRSALNAPHED